MRRINKPIWLLCAFAIVVTAFAARGDAQLPQTRGVQAAGEIGVDPIEEPGGAKSTLPFGVQFAACWGLDLLDGVADGVYNYPEGADGRGIDVYVVDSCVISLMRICQRHRTWHYVIGASISWNGSRSRSGINAILIGNRCNRVTC